MLSDKEYENMIQTLNTGGEVQISGFNDTVNFIFDRVPLSLPGLSESKYKTMSGVCAVANKTKIQSN